MKEIYEFDLSSIDDFSVTNDLYEGRTIIADTYQKMNSVDSEVTICVGAYNRLEKTKRCIESILKYTKNVNYDLLLVDNGSDDGTFEYFKSINYDKLRVVRLNKNLSSGFIYHIIDRKWLSKYCALVANDLIVTENWLSNLLTVMKSDNKIGMVNPVSSNVSNYQEVDLNFSSYEEMQAAAAEFNKSDPTRWHERIRLITLGTLYSRECFLALGWPYQDSGFFHDFGDDDITFRVRRAGYKAILAADTWIHHDHDVYHLENKDPAEFQNSLDCGRKNFQDKYFGIDAWDDVVMNHVFFFIDDHISGPADPENVKILGIDTRCGSPILDIKNSIREYGVFNSGISAFTTESKYHIDLKTICNEQVVCDRIEFVYNSFKSNYFDYIVMGESVNEYHDPIRVIRDVYALLKKGGQMFISLKNTYNVFTLMELLGHEINYDEMASHIRVEKLYEELTKIGIEMEIVKQELFDADKTITDFTKQIVGIYKPRDAEENLIINKLLIKKYWIKIVK